MTASSNSLKTLKNLEGEKNKNEGDDDSNRERRLDARNPTWISSRSLFSRVQLAPRNHANPNIQCIRTDERVSFFPSFFLSFASRVNRSLDRASVIVVVYTNGGSRDARVSLPFSSWE